MFFFVLIAALGYLITIQPKLFKNRDFAGKLLRFCEDAILNKFSKLSQL